MKVFHPHHRTAWSIRTQGFPLLGISRKGEIVWEGETSKRAGFLDIPDETVYILWGYSSNSGRPSVTILKAADGLPEVAGVNDTHSPGEAEEILAEHGIPKGSPASQWVLAWLFEEDV